MDSTQITVTISRAQAEWLRRQAAREHRSVSRQIGLYIEYGIHEHERLAHFVRPNPAEYDPHDPRRLVVIWLP